MSNSAEAATDPKIGMNLQGRYQILRKLGDGGMGAVYEGLHTVIKRRVAIKVLHPQFAQNPEIVARFHREAEAATSIGHPNIVEVTDMGSFPDGSAYMVLEFLDGRDWSHDIEGQGPQSLGKVAHILSQCCNALEEAHAKGIVHRDLKPENIFLIERSGDPDFVKIVDFGISKIMDGADSPGHSLTQTGTALGTPYYMAPEQCQGKKDIDHRADIYSLGVILFQSLTGQYPFDDESYPMLVLKICTEQPPLLSAYRPDLPPQMQGILHRMLAKNRDNRFATVGELRDALTPYLGQTAAPVVATDAPSTASRGPSVLHGPPTATPVSSPTGTAFLPSNPGIAPGGTPYPLEVPGNSGKGLILAAAAVLGLMVAVGIGTGAYFATRGEGGDPQANLGSTNSPPEPVEAPDPEASAPAVAQSTRVMSIITTTPSEARLLIDGQDRGNPFADNLTPGSHRIQATHEGYVSIDETVEIASPAPFRHPVVMEREPEPEPEVVAAAPARPPRPPRPHTRPPPIQPVPMGGSGQPVGRDPFGRTRTPPPVQPTRSDRVSGRTIFD